MLRVRAVREQIRSGTPEQIEAAIINLGSALLFGCLPLLFTFILLIISEQFTKENLKPLLLNGDLLMLTNATVAAASMMIGKERRSRDKFPGGELFILLGSLLIAISAALFLVTKLFELLHYTKISNYALLAAVVVVFLSGVYYSYLVVLLDGICQQPHLDPEGDFEKDEQALLAKRRSRKRAASVPVAGGTQ